MARDRRTRGPERADRRGTVSARLTARGAALSIAAFAVLVLSTFANRREGLFVTALLLVLVAVSLVAARLARPEARAERSMPDEVQAGDELTVTAVVTGRARLAGVTGWSETLPEGWGAASSPPAGGGFERGDRFAIRYRAVPARRGAYEVGPLVMEVEDALGLVRSRCVADGVSRIVVTPRIAPLTASPLLSADGEGLRRERRHLSAPRVDELIAREYRPGDPLRRVHWRATARRGELMVRQEEQEGDPEALLVVDTGSDVPPERFDAMADLAASIGVHLLDAGYRLRLTLTVAAAPAGTAPRTRLMTRDDRRELLTTLATCEQAARAAQQDVIADLRASLAGAGRSTPLLLVSGSGDVEELARLGPLAALADPAVLFLSGGLASGARVGDELGEQGWRCSWFGTDPASAWDRALLDARPAGAGGRNGG